MSYDDDEIPLKDAAFERARAELLSAKAESVIWGLLNTMEKVDKLLTKEYEAGRLDAETLSRIEAAMQRVQFPYLPTDEEVEKWCQVRDGVIT